MTDYRVNLEIYNGPLDLLLYLIRRDEIDIYDIPIATVTEQFLRYVELIKSLNLEQAGDFLVMAATLMEIKSAMLLPRDERQDGQEDDLGDPRLELVRQLLEYKKFKDIAGDLAESAEQRADRFPRSLVDLQRLRDQIRQEQELDMDQLQIWDLFDAFNRLMKATLAGKDTHDVVHDETPIDIYETEILYRAQQEKTLRFEEIFRNCKNCVEMIGMFLALLELVRQRLIRIEQEKSFGPIYIFALTDEAAEIAVAHAVSADIDDLPSKITKEKRQSDHVDQHPIPE
jgi:segregation and condensation protein A